MTSGCPAMMNWIQVRDIHAGHDRLAAAGVSASGARNGALGLIEMWIEHPGGIRIVLIEVPAYHPVRRYPRSLSPPLSAAPGGGAP